MGSLPRVDPTLSRGAPSVAGEPNEDRRPLPETAWAYRTPRLRALGLDFAVRASNETVGRYLHGLFRAFEVRGEPDHIYTFIDRDESPDERYEVYSGNELLNTTRFANSALRYLLWDVNRRVVEGTPDLLLFHASGAEHDGRAVLFPAPMGSGKTTLVAGLVGAGLRYISDEAIAIDPATLMVQPYPKPLSIDTGSWDVLPDLRPRLSPTLAPFLEGGWYVPADAIHEDAIAGPCGPAFVIAPRYEPGAPTELVQIRRSEALITLAENSFNITTFGARTSMEILASVVRGCRCFRLVVGDLADACARVLRLLGATPRRAFDG